jgi:hypothetical protein
MTTTDSAKQLWERCPKRSWRFVHAAVVAGFTATLMLSCNALADEHQGDTVADGHYDAGVEERRKGNLPLALEHLRKAWAARHSARIAMKLAQTELDLAYYRDAIEHLEFYLQQPEPSETDRAAAKKMLAGAKSKIVMLEIRVDTPGAKVLVDQAVVGVAPLSQEISVDPGKRLVEARKEGCTFERITAEFAPGSRQNLLFTCKRPLPQPPPPSSTWKYWAVPVTAVVSAGILGSGIALRLRANDLSETADAHMAALVNSTPTTMDTCGDGSPAINAPGCRELKSMRADKDLSANLATAGFIAGGIGLAGAAVMAFWPTRARHKVRVTPVVTSSASGAVIGFSF